MADRYIRREDAKEYLKRVIFGADQKIDCWIDCIPSADVRRNLRGHWVSNEEAEAMGEIYKECTCSVCGHLDWDCTESENFNYCPNCGAMMDAGAEEATSNG